VPASPKGGYIADSYGDVHFDGAECTGTAKGFGMITNKIHTLELSEPQDVEISYPADSITMVNGDGGMFTSKGENGVVKDKVDVDVPLKGMEVEFDADGFAPGCAGEFQHGSALAYEVVEKWYLPRK
jgi:hypothetical protein